MICSIYENDLVRLQISIEDKFVTSITMDVSKMKGSNYINKVNQSSTLSETKVLEQLISQLDSYFLGRTTKLNVPLKINATPFAKKVYEVLLKSEYGKTYSYKEIAKLAGSPRASRAVGSAMKKNEFAIIIPCHRVIKANGDLGEYFGNTNLKEKLLNLESKGE